MKMSKLHKLLLRRIFRKVIRQGYLHELTPYFQEIIKMWREEFTEDTGKTTPYITEIFEKAEDELDNAPK